MGLLGMVGKMAGTTILKRVEENIDKKQNREQTSKYCIYIKNNLVKICEFIATLQDDTQTIIREISSAEGLRMSFWEKREFAKTKKDAITNLQYLYLIRDFFTILSKNASGITLSNEELVLIQKFAPFFDGVPVLNLPEEEDDSLFGEFREIKKEFFGPSKKDYRELSLEEYVSKYIDKINIYEIPDVYSAIENFQNAMAYLESAASENIDNNEEQKSTVTEPTVEDTPKAESVETITCPSCQTNIGIKSKFCPECGVKIQPKKATFCIQCGEQLPSGAKFCANCGTKV